MQVPARTVGGELLPEDDFTSKTLPTIIDTLVSPDAIGADASRSRLQLAEDAGALDLALDTADTIQATDGLERMLSHQMAAAHVMAMQAAALMKEHLEHAGRTRGHEQQMAGVEAARMAGAFARLTGSYQAGMQTLQRVRSGGRQTVIVQHNHISPGSQNVIGAQQQVGGGASPRPKRVRG
ncbi:hypothetical protein MKK75_14800 [Methylobacterium sp. J-030]|uniref:hypothetical protein n=1 Tax=Methylobacterium sp. J-030 TaxID=2836627 RepID=UPI001FB8FD84|nr:hypothetical protein [Methylobacterium sp. J-030]MCJ2070048.1 hypothetical protein [Methylobacterium sp. J-030]